MNDPASFYRDLILEHAKSEKHVGPLPSATGCATLHNPLCGDTITVRVELDASGVVARARYEAEGCAIAKAVASLMVDRSTGQSAERVQSWARQSHAAVAGKGELGFDELSGVAALPARERCATLPWDCLAQAIDDSEGTAS
jgi:nitrogen fixation NifU-like protein